MEINRFSLKSVLRVLPHIYRYFSDFSKSMSGTISKGSEKFHGNIQFIHIQCVKLNTNVNALLFQPNVGFQNVCYSPQCVNIQKLMNTIRLNDFIFISRSET